MDRRKLDSFNFVRTVTQTQKHARVTVEFIASVRDPDAFVVFTLLRSKGPKHRWKTDLVIAAINQQNLTMGKERVEKAMAHLNKLGWIRYVDLVEPNQHKAGAIVEVMAEQLPEPLRGKRPRIVSDPQGNLRWIDPTPGHSAKTSLSPGANVTDAPPAPKAGITEVGPSYPRSADASGAHYPDFPLPGNPGEWKPGEQYIVNVVGESPTPFNERGSDVPPGRDYNEGNHPGATVPEDRLTHQPGESPPKRSGLPDSEDVESADAHPGGPLIDWDALARMALEAQSNPARIPEYEHFLENTVFLHLREPVTDGKSWTRKTAMDWCCQSEKARFLLWLSSDKEWSSDLPRKFVKSPSRWSVAHLKRILLTRVFLVHQKAPLTDLLNTSAKQPRDGQAEGPSAPWSSLVQKSETIWETLTRRHREEVRAFRGSSNSPEELVARKEEWIQEVLENPYTTYLDENSPDQIFKWFLEQIHRPLRRGVAVEKKTFLENADRYRDRLTEYVAGSRVAMFIVESDRVDQNNRMLWDLVLGKDLPERRRRLAESLNRRSRLLGLDGTVEP